MLEYRSWERRSIFDLHILYHYPMETSKWIISTRNKLKMALALIAVASLLFIANVFEREHVSSIDESFLSIYADRLVPATAIFEIREHLYKKQNLLTGLVHGTNPDIPAQKNDVDSANWRIDHLLSEYKKTYFWEKETGHLQAFEAYLHQYNRFENIILSSYIGENENNSALIAYEGEALGHLNNALGQLSALNRMQSEIGKDMLFSSKKDMAGFLLLSNLETFLIIVFGLIAHVLIYASRAVIQRRVDTFHMN